MSVCSKLRTVTEHLETSVAHAGTPESKAAYLNQMPHIWPDPRKRAVAHGLSLIAMQFPGITERIIHRRLPDCISYAGAGAQSIAYRIGDTVIKVNRTTINMEESDRLAFAAQEQEKHDIVEIYLGATAIDQRINVQEHPLDPSSRAVQITQPFCQFMGLDNIFPMASERLNYEASHEHLRSRQDLDEQLARFATSSLLMAQETSYIPDTNGRNNLGLVYRTDDLILVDRQPLPIDDIAAEQCIIPQMTALQQYLDPARSS
ncbi:MAG TPA: hypothetical protein VK983_02130 [Candidatus Limnocylindrales bacterium]|nr:hypothetical protein [Candidatus Limnocylindrales bacterium]